ncbi:cell filamentation protein [Rhizobium sp. PP-CC-3A-592]|nr:cell filamentation protein [Rhizobium sp. PP-CC-3A-592]
MALHHHLFQDVYDWTGTARTIRIGKGYNWFCYPEHIDQQMKAAFATLEGHSFLADKRPAEFATLAAEALAWLNAIHPFREGNGRTQLAFLSMLAEQAGLPFDDDQLARDRVIAAMIDGFGGDEDPLCKLTLDLVSA